MVVDDAAIALAESAQVRAAVEHDLDASELVELGAVLTGDAPGRVDPDAITVHSSIGVAMQDLAAARLVLRAHGIAVPLDPPAPSRRPVP